MSANTEFEKKKERHASGQSNQSTDSVSNYIPTPPDGGYGWVIVFAAFMIHVIVDGVTFTFGIFYMAFLDYFQESKARTSLVGSLLGGFYLIMCVVASALVNKYGCRPVCLAGSLISCVGFTLSVFAPNLETLMVTYGVIGGTGFALMYFPCIIAVSFYFQKRRAIATGIAVCGAGVGGFLFAPLGRAMLATYDWKGSMLLVAGVSLQGAVCAMLLRPLEPPKRKRRPRAKNAIDRILEKTKRNRQESECSACATNTKGCVTIMERIQEVKLAREQMLREEDSESDMGNSMPGSTLNSVRRLDRSDSYPHSAAYGCSPRHSKPINIEGASAHTPGGTPGGGPCSVGSVPEGSPYWVAASAPSAFGAYMPQGSPATEPGSVTSSVVPRIVVDEDCAEDADDETSHVGSCADPDSRRPSTRRISEVSMATSDVSDAEGAADVVEVDKREFSASKPPTLANIKEGGEGGEGGEGAALLATRRASDRTPRSALDRVKSNGHVTMNGSLPSGMSGVVGLEKAAANGHLTVNFNEDLSRKQSKSASDVWAIQRVKKPRLAPPRGVEKTDYARPLYRKDIFYSGSLLHVPQFRSQADVHSYVKSVTSIPASLSPDQESPLCRCLPKSAADTLRQMMDVALFKDPIFVIACFGNIFAFVGIFVPFIYIVNRAVQVGIPTEQAAFLLSVIGILNMAGRILAGTLADFKWVNALLLHNLSVIGAGLCCILNMFSTSYAQLCVFAAFFGVFLATYISLTSIVLCDLLGIERLTNAFGLLCMIRGVASIAGPPIAGFVFDASQDYNTSFHFGGVMLVLAGLLFCLLHLPFFQEQSQQFNMLQDPDVIEVVFDDELAAQFPAGGTAAGDIDGVLVKRVPDLDSDIDLV